LARLVGLDRPKRLLQKTQSIARASFTNACFISMIWSSRERHRRNADLSRTIAQLMHLNVQDKGTDRSRSLETLPLYFPEFERELPRYLSPP